MSEWRWLPVAVEYRRDAPGIVAVVRYYGPGRHWGYTTITDAGDLAEREGFRTADIAQTEADRLLESLQPVSQGERP